MFTAIYHAKLSSDLIKEVRKDFPEFIRVTDKAKWYEARDEEMKTHKENGTFELVPLPKGVNLIGSRWVLSIKDTGKYKVRLVAQRFSQRKDIDDKETFSPVVKQASVRLLLKSTGKEKMQVHQMDVTTALLNGELQEVIHMRQPKSWFQASKDGRDLILKPRKSI